jgi:hypothetical protein
LCRVGFQQNLGQKSVMDSSVTLKIQMYRANMDSRQSNATPELHQIHVTPAINTQAVSWVNTLPISNQCHTMLRYFATIWHGMQQPTMFIAQLFVTINTTIITINTITHYNQYHYYLSLSKHDSVIIIAMINN